MARGPQPDLEPEALRPTIAPRADVRGPWLVLGLAALAGLVVFFWLSGHRPLTHPVQQARSVQVSTPIEAPPPPADLAALETASRTPPPPAPAPGMAPPPVSLPPPLPPPLPLTTTVDSAAQAARAPVLVVDFGRSGGAPESGPAAGPAAKSAPSPGEGGAGLNADERFIARIEGGPEPAKVSATMLRNQATLIPQGTTIPAVLETALNSDLPGYARAVVSRDVRSFDAATVLIPRGSRVIGEYRSAVAQGQRRAFVVWTRVLRPDGASIMIGSGGGDTLGRAGLAGKVDTHFLEEFSGAVLLTVLNAGGAAVAGVPSTEVVIGAAGAGAANNLAGPLAAFAPVAIPPTIKVAQGTPVLIFVQRDLDFSRVEGSAK